MKFDLQQTEIMLYISLVIAVIILILFYFRSSRKRKKIFRPITTEDNSPKPQKEQSILEIFDYLGTKIVHENGTYTVNHKGKVSFYKSWELVPKEFQKMVKELDNRSGLAKKNDDYFLEVINGIYYLTMPDGSIKKYNRLSDVPAYIRKAVGKL
ncbi:MAG TPA: hypothetical protein PK079_02490 [Leptospiraceae bacterium]|nr:hypothetical protein [Leptospiraceae bacterium]HMW04073.1 hypothetical protein [Leptospiraceae bacterium]HMX30860.1 hypothetical protein [Leptospiraceae bacterium]HMY30067.1 hypothetical protein [Leptospiraceae bacterium]HMZ62746.1 hypothetical protein [Leptospiraceae bacterium]